MFSAEPTGRYQTAFNFTQGVGSKYLLKVNYEGEFFLPLCLPPVAWSIVEYMQHLTSIVDSYFCYCAMININLMILRLKYDFSCRYYLYALLVDIE